MAQVLKVFDMPDNSKSAIVQGISRVKILKYVQDEPYFKVSIELLKDNKIVDPLSVDA